MDLKKLRSWLAVISGGLIGLVGVVFVFMYANEAIFARRGDPDQSLLFWYLPILFMGLFGIMIGLALLKIGLNRLRKTR